MTAKKNNTAQFALVLLLGTALGSGGMYASKSETSLGNDYATAMCDNNILVFIGANPINKYYEVLEEVKMDNLFEVADAGNNESGKGKFWKKLLEVGTKAYQNISIGERISKFSSEAKNEYPNADAIIIAENFRTATVIKFKQ